MGRKLAPALRHSLMARFRSTNTKPELLLRRKLTTAGMRGYRLHVKDLPGKPDVAYMRWRVAIFVDGVFWHGHPSAFQAGTKGDYWDWKIQRNQERDRIVNNRLAADGWTVIRLWDVDVLRDPAQAVGTILAALADARTKRRSSRWLV